MLTQEDIDALCEPETSSDMPTFIVRHLRDAYVPYEATVKAETAEQAAHLADKLDKDAWFKSDVIEFDAVRVQVTDSNGDFEEILFEIPE